jgi:hypothetical protein
MLTLHANDGDTDCGGNSRRDFLRVGTLGLGGLTLPWLFEQQATAAAAGKDYVKDKAIILLFLCGAPSHIETFDPHMDAPAPIRSMTGEIKTALPGVTFGATFPGLAKHADKLAIVRSYSPHQISDHATAIKHVIKGGDPVKLGASIGSMITRLAGAQPINGVPPFAEVIRRETEDEYMQDADRMRVGGTSGKLGTSRVAVCVSGIGILPIRRSS